MSSDGSHVVQQVQLDILCVYDTVCYDIITLNEVELSSPSMILVKNPAPTAIYKSS